MIFTYQKTAQTTTHHTPIYAQVWDCGRIVYKAKYRELVRKYDKAGRPSVAFVDGFRDIDPMEAPDTYKKHPERFNRYEVGNIMAFIRDLNRELTTA
ncbi:hypothetical protein EBB07_29290 [Paenibacillaceae bacterium]|nr:hypothetical protein EBB07_29290 [Paenibacillaceae bacterium]